jgi:hypothetical protein
VVTRDRRKIIPRLDLFNHSPTGLEWGYGGSGPAQTALAILADFMRSPNHVCHENTCGTAGCIEDEMPVLLHQKFKWEVIAKLPHKGWFIKDVAIRAWLNEHAAEIAELTGRKGPILRAHADLK